MVGISHWDSKEKGTGLTKNKNTEVFFAPSWILKR